MCNLEKERVSGFIKKNIQRIGVEAKTGSGTQAMDAGTPSVSKRSVHLSVAYGITGGTSFTAAGAQIFNKQV